MEFLTHGVKQIEMWLRMFQRRETLGFYLGEELDLITIINIIN